MQRGADQRSPALDAASASSAVTKMGACPYSRSNADRVASSFVQIGDPLDPRLRPRRAVFPGGNRRGG